MIGDLVDLSVLSGQVTALVIHPSDSICYTAMQKGNCLGG